MHRYLPEITAATLIVVAVCLAVAEQKKGAAGILAALQLFLLVVTFLAKTRHAAISRLCATFAVALVGIVINQV